MVLLGCLCMSLSSLPPIVRLLACSPAIFENSRKAVLGACIGATKDFKRHVSKMVAKKHSGYEPVPDTLQVIGNVLKALEPWIHRSFRSRRAGLNGNTSAT